ncbi:adenylyl-sulfate kinase [Phytoactinopolyspora endophytica]|uniref:adenylyl-sulfate kinase n=1 Tax=Phytoactinopolyspora endophytica TaxID=1642495 RepID=UPI00197C67F0|nr:adenylyl-sulfate kinase [Phytoactinopolyspora endophytica]
MNDAPVTQPPSTTPDPVTLAEVELALFGIGSMTVTVHVPPKIGGEATQTGRMIITDREGAPVAALLVGTVSGSFGVPAPSAGDAASGDAESGDTDRDVTIPISGSVERISGGGDEGSADEHSPGPYPWLRLTPGQARFDGAAAIVGHDPVDVYALDAVDPDRALLLAVLDGPRAVPGPDAPAVVRAALGLCDRLREQGRSADVVLVPAPQYGDARDDKVADAVAEAYGTERVRADRAPNREQLFAGLDGRAELPVSEWPRSSLDAWRRWRPPRSERGLVVFFTGLSGSGKSTVARAVVDRLNEMTDRTITLLDGDIVRRHLSAGLGFSRVDRDRNIERIGFVAAEIARHGGITVCAPIAPFAATRARVRAMAEAGGDFLLVHVATPLEECERRDRKGLYARARKGEIADFTGISSPYEEPDDADLVLDTTHVTIPQARDTVLDLLSNGGWVRPYGA